MSSKSESILLVFLIIIGRLANCFVQQANMLTKLQGIAGQKITVERVVVNQGGQAVVGNIQGGQIKK